MDFVHARNPGSTGTRLLVPGVRFPATGWGRSLGEEVGRPNPWRVTSEHADLATLV